MSSIEQPVDSQLIEQTKRQIQALVAEISQLSKQNVTPASFTGNSWGVSSRPSPLSGGQFGPRTTTVRPGAPISNPAGTDQPSRRRAEAGPAWPAALQGAGRAGEGMLVPPHSGFGERGRGGQSDRLPAGPRPAEDRPGDGRAWSRSSSAAKPRGQRAAGLSAVPAADVRAGRPTSSRATSCGTFPTGRCCGPGWRILPAAFTPRSNRWRRPTPSPTRGGG